MCHGGESLSHHLPQRHLLLLLLLLLPSMLPLLPMPTPTLMVAMYLHLLRQRHR